ncbi:MAG TPA: hypothetical protein VGK14_07510 [Novimethylophilus sp.]|jgi:hypothetical protein|uniref:hypothetical protein n=1 Tax=Novimethylophilus sp. TaxID=2137426 RepID=UPI002F3F1C68
MNRDWFEGWPGQYRRMLRWRDRLSEVYGSDDTNTIYDFIYAFFQSCYHLRDWLVSDNVATKEEITALFNSSIELQLCRDICNATKHLQYNTPSIDPRPRIGKEWDPWKKESYGLYLYSDKRRPISELVHECVTTWDKFLDEKGLKEKLTT